MHVFGKHLECCSHQTDLLLLDCIRFVTTLRVSTVHMRSSGVRVSEFEICMPHLRGILSVSDRLIFSYDPEILYFRLREVTDRP